MASYIHTIPIVNDCFRNTSNIIGSLNDDRFDLCFCSKFVSSS